MPPETDRPPFNDRRDIDVSLIASRQGSHKKGSGAFIRDNRLLLVVATKADKLLWMTAPGASKLKPMKYIKNKKLILKYGKASYKYVYVNGRTTWCRSVAQFELRN